MLMDFVHDQPLILASASLRRLDLLAQIGVKPQHIYHAEIDEKPKRAEHPYYLARRLAYEKAEKTIHALEHKGEMQNAIILAADTVVAAGRIILPKPANLLQAEEYLNLLSGRGHKVYTAVVLAYRGKLRHRIVETRVRFNCLSPQIIKHYLESQEWRGKAGGYAIQGLAASFIARIVGSYSAVVGLPLAETADLLRIVNYPIYHHWTARN